MVDHKGVIYPGEHDGLIDQKTWDKVHETLRRNGGDKGATVRNKLGALLRGVLFCVPCGTPMMHTYTMRKSKRYRYYVCYSAQQQGWQNCETKSVSAQAIESAVLDSFRRIGTDRKLAEAVALEALDQLVRRRRDLDQEIDSQRRDLRQFNETVAREATDTSVDSGARQVLYHLPEVLEAPIVFVVEGERDVETLREYGFVATTNAGGAKAHWAPQYTEALRGREVILIPDNDAPGRKRVLNIARALLGQVARLVVLELEGGSKDVTEWFSQGHSELELIAQLDGEEVSSPFDRCLKIYYGTA